MRTKATTSSNQLCALACALLLAPLVQPLHAELPGQISTHPAYPAFLFYHQGGPFFMAGPGDPEGFLFRGTQNADGTRDGDQQALLDKLIPTGANSIYLMAVRSHGGDGDATQNPFIDNDPTLGLNEAVLDQWEDWFSQMDSAGVTIFLFLYDDGSSIWQTGDAVGPEEAEFIHALVDRFEHHRHLIWVVAEEYQERFSPTRVSAIAAEFKAADDHDHPVAVHKLSGLSFDEFADDPALDQYAIQYNVTSAQQIHDGLEIAWNEALGRYNLNMSEAADWGAGAVSRKKAWAAATTGSHVMVYQMDIASSAIADMEDLGRLRTFMESTDFYTMEPRDDLATGDTDYVLAREGKSYIVYAGSGSAALGLQDFFAGTYDLRWHDIPSGSEIVQEGVPLDAGAQSWTRPAGIGSETAVYVLRTDGPNDRPVVVDQTVSTATDQPLDLALGFLDPDGPGPYTYTVETHPSHGTLSGAAPELTYIPNPGFTGVDEFTWNVDDGIDSSAAATVSIGVSFNAPPTATDFTITGAIDSPLSVPFSEHANDAEGDPLSFVVATPPTHGELVLQSGLWIYTPDPGFSGVDTALWQAHDGVSLSDAAEVNFSIQLPLFADSFDRADSGNVGNGWTEVEIDGDALVESQALAFDALDESERPLVRRNFARQRTGVVTWRFDFGFRRTGSEGIYAFHMQLGDGELMSDGSPDRAGVAVNLLWGGPTAGFSDHERLGVTRDGAVTELAPLSGEHALEVVADLDVGTFSLTIDGAAVALDLPFDDAVEVNTVRFYADNLNSQNFLDRWIDDLWIEAPCSAPDGFELTLADDYVTTIESYEVCSTLTVGPDWTVGPGGDVTLKAGERVSLGDGTSIDVGGQLVVGHP